MMWVGFNTSHRYILIFISQIKSFWIFNALTFYSVYNININYLP